jgi:4-amino-4-deoxy-L-arabinose transferase-like glycosyltransferase
LNRLPSTGVVFGAFDRAGFTVADQQSAKNFQETGSGDQSPDLASPLWTRGVKVNSDAVSLALLSLLWIIMSALVNPIGNFPLNDDWVYALGVKSILQTGRFELPGLVPAGPNVFAQAYWGALFCLPLGFSFTALRVSTLVLGGAGIIALYLMLREIGGSRWIALLGGLTLAVNPLYFGLANTFMTDVPFVALVVIAIWLFVRGIRRGETVCLLAGIMIAAVDILIRQVGILLLFAFGIAYVMQRGITWKSLVVAMVPAALGAVLHSLYQHWMIETGRTPFFQFTTLSYLIPTTGPAFVRCAKHSLRLLLSSLPYLGFFLAPFLISVVLRGTRVPRGIPSRVCLSVFALAGVLVITLHAVHTPVPEIGNILMPYGLGPRTLRDTFLLGQNLPSIPASLQILWVGAIILGASGATVLLVYFVRSALHVSRGLWRPNRRPLVWVEALALGLIGAYGGLCLLFSFGYNLKLFDRYLLVVVPALLVLVFVNEARDESTPTARSRAALSLALLGAYAAISVAATHDYLAWNRTRWIATGSLMRSGVPPNQIEGGYEFNGWYLSNLKYRRTRNKMGWWADGDEYVIASGPLSGYREVQRFEFRRWLTLADASVVVLHRTEPESR